MKTNNSLFFLFLFLFFFSCEKEVRSPLNDLPNEHVEFVDDDKLGLEFLVSSTTFDGQILSFQSSEDFINASIAVTNISRQNYTQWCEKLGFTSYYSSYQSILDKFEDTPDDLFDVTSFLSGEELANYYFVMDDGAYDLRPNLSGGSISRLVNNKGLVEIAGSLHYFSDQLHIMVTDGNFQKMEQAILNSDIDIEGVYVTNQEEADFYGEKVNNKLVNCIGNSVTDVEHQETLQNQRIVVKLKSYIFTTTWSSDQIQFNWSVRGIMENKRKKGLKWIRTWTNLRFEIPTYINIEANLAYRTSPSTYTTVGGYPRSIGLPAPVITAYDYTDVADVDELLIGSQTSSTYNSNLDWLQTRKFAGGKLKGLRTSESASPSQPVDGTHLEITVGCN
ncbi:MAG: hypothetical protein R2795_04970 [Saprospiraceae bacterium]